MRDIKQIDKEIAALNEKRATLLRSFAILGLKQIQQRTDYWSRVSPFGAEMKAIDDLRKYVRIPAALHIEETTIESLAREAIEKPQTHGYGFFVRVGESWGKFEAATGLNRKDWCEKENKLSYEIAVLSIERDSLVESLSKDHVSAGTNV